MLSAQQLYFQIKGAASVYELFNKKLNLNWITLNEYYHYVSYSILSVGTFK